jgi:hypothetical protein
MKDADSPSKFRTTGLAMVIGIDAVYIEMDLLKLRIERFEKILPCKSAFGRGAFFFQINPRQSR